MTRMTTEDDGNTNNCGGFGCGGNNNVETTESGTPQTKINADKFWKDLIGIDIGIFAIIVCVLLCVCVCSIMSYFQWKEHKNEIQASIKRSDGKTYNSIHN